MVALLFSYLSCFIHPSTIPGIPLFGLGYWIISLFYLVILIIWAIARSRWSLIMLGLFLLGGKLHFRTFSLGWDEENEQQRTELKVSSYNVRLFDLYNPSKSDALKTRNQIFDYLKNQDADVYCIQEYYHQDPPTPFKTKDTLMKLLKTPRMHARTSITDAKRQEFGVAIFSRHKIIAQGEVSFSAINKTNNYCVYIDLVKNKDTFRVYNVHLQSIRLQKDDYALFNEQNIQSGEENSRLFNLTQKIVRAYPVRAEQTEKVVEHIKQSPYPVIVCGDFNDTPMSYCYNQYASILTDAFRNTSKGLGITYAGKVPAGRIDYIFHSNSLGSRNFEIQKEKLSDHYGISCTLFPH